MCAIMTEEELRNNVIVDVVSTDFRRNGEMKRRGIVWFPSLWKQLLNFVSTGFLINNKDYCRTCEYYYGNMTFAEVIDKKLCF